MDLTSVNRQKTVRSEILVAGSGIFTGEPATVVIAPAPPNTGILFERIDLKDAPPIPAQIGFVRPATRCTQLSCGSASVLMVEHLLSALYAYGVDNARIRVKGPEIPGLDGSSLLWSERLEEVGVVEQDSFREQVILDRPVYFSEGNIHLMALPSSEVKYSYVLHYPHSSFLKSQYYSFTLSESAYRKEVAPCRTFSLYEEILPFIEKGLIKGGGLESAVVIRGDQVMNTDGLRFPDEPVRHKLLDLIGDLSLVGIPFLAHIVAIRSGHAANAAFAKLLFETLSARSAHV